MGIYERDYMNASAPGSSGAARVLWGLIVANVAMFLLAQPGSKLFLDLALWSVPEKFGFWQLVTAAFLHGNWTHLLFNMWGLYLFGKFLLPYFRNWQFLLLYAAGILCGNLLYLALNWGKPSLLVGASGAVCAVMMAAAMLEPEQRIVILLMPFAPLKMSTMIIGYTVLEILLCLDNGDGIAHLAHLGGFFGGYLVMKLLFRHLPWDPWRYIKGKRYAKVVSAGNVRRPSEKSDPNRPVSAAELDALLDKLSNSGINSLSEYELSRLRQAREEMRNRQNES